MKTKKIVECEVLYIESSIGSTPEKPRYDVAIKQIETNIYNKVETKKNVYGQLKSRIKLEKGHQVLTLEEGSNKDNGRAWLAVVETSKPVKQ